MNHPLHLPWPRLRKLTAVLYLMVLLTLTHIPNPKYVPDLPGKDKTLHVVAYGLAALLVLAGFLRTLRWTHILPVVIGLLVFGMLDEWTQPWFRRTCDFYDWLADLNGVIAGTLLFAAACTYTRLKQTTVSPD